MPSRRSLPTRAPADPQATGPLACRPTPVAVAIRSALLMCAMSGALVVALPGQARAQSATATPAAASKRTYTIPAGSLDQVLNRFAGEGGVELSVDSKLTQGKSSSGLSGSYTVTEGFEQIVRGQGLQVTRADNGTYSLRVTSAATQGENYLPAYKVKATSELSATTEGGGYAANAVTMFGSTESLKDIPSSVSVVTRQQMDDQNITSINDAMRYTTGVSSINYTGNSGTASTAYYTARGFPVDVTLDGVSIVNGLQYMPQFDMAMYDRAEVFRGPAGLTDGQGDLGGSVNLVRKMPTSQFQFNSETQIGSWDNYREMIDVSGPLNQDGTLRGRVVGVGNTADSFIDGEHSREGMGYAALAYDIDPRTTVSLTVAYQTAPDYRYDWGVGYDSNNNLVIGPRGWSQNFAPDWAYSSQTFKEATATLKHQFDNGWKVEATVLSRQFDTYAKYAFTGDPDAGTNIGDYDGQRQDLKYNWLGFDAHASGQVTLFDRKNDVVVGTNYTSYKYQGLYGSQDMGNYNIFAAADIPEPAMPYTSGGNEDIDQFSLYGHVVSHLTDRFSLVLGGQDIFFKQQSKTTLPTVSDWSTDAKENGKFVPYGGLIYALTSQISAYASYAEQFSPQTGTTYTGAALQPFTARQYEVGFKGGFLDNRLNATVAVFRINGDNLEMGDQEHPNYYVTTGAVRSQGWEAEVSGSPLPNWNVIAGYTQVNTSYTSSPTDQGQSYNGETPRNLFKLWNTYRFAQGPLQGLTVGGGMYVQSNTWRIDPQYHQSGYALFSGKVGYQFNQHLEANVVVNNLFDKRYYDRAPSSYFAEYGAPRNVMLTVRVAY